MNFTAKLRKTPPPPRQLQPPRTTRWCSTRVVRLQLGAGQHLCLRLLAGRNVCSGTA